MIQITAKLIMINTEQDNGTANPNCSIELQRDDKSIVRVDGLTVDQCRYLTGSFMSNITVSIGAP
jgi:hypothetical protein